MFPPRATSAAHRQSQNACIGVIHAIAKTVTPELALRGPRECVALRNCGGARKVNRRELEIGVVRAHDDSVAAHHLDPIDAVRDTQPRHAVIVLASPLRHKEGAAVALWTA